MDRKSFIKKAVAATLLAAPIVNMLGCSSSDDSYSNNNNGPSGNDNANCSENGARASSITGNHGHSLTVSKDDVNAGVEKTYSIQGSSGHIHNVTITASNFSTLQNNQQITLTSTSGNNHTHSVTVSCA